jgi:hypothetical protein
MQLSNTYHYQSKKVFDLALAKCDEVQKSQIAFKNAQETFDLYIRQAFATCDKKSERGQMTKLYAKLAIIRILYKKNLILNAV